MSSTLRTLGVGGLCGLVAAGLVVALPSAAGAVPGPVVIEVPGAVGVAVDDATQRVFVSTGTNDSVEVFAWDGTAVDTLENIDDVRRLSADPVAGVIYATESAANKIVAIDASTLEVTRYPVAGTPCPTSVVPMDGVLYYTHLDDGCSSWPGGIGRLDPNADTPVGVTVDDSASGDDILTGAVGTLVSTTAGISPASLHSLRATPNGTSFLDYRWDVGGNAKDLAISPDGSEVVLAAGYPYEHPAFDPLTLDSLYTYPSTSYPQSAAFSSDGSLLAVATSNFDLALRLFERGSTTPVQTWTSAELLSQLQIVGDGLAFGSNTHLFAIGEASGSEYLVITKLSGLDPSRTDISVPTELAMGDTVHLSGQVHAAGSDLTGQTVAISRVRDGVATPIGTATLDELGNFTYDDPTDTRGFVRYLARWSGDGLYAPSLVASTPVRVLGEPTSLQVSLDAASYGPYAQATVTVVLGHDDDTADAVELYRKDTTGRTLVGTGTFVGGVFTTTATVTTNGRFIAKYQGDNVHVPTTVASDPFTIKPRVRIDVDGYFRRTTDGVWLFRPAIDPHVSWRVTPAPIGDCAVTVLQKMTSTGWQTLRRSACYDRSTSDTLGELLDDPHRNRTQWRIRMLSTGAETHEDIKSRWTYVTFKKF